MPKKKSFKRGFHLKAALPDAKGMLHDSIECTCATSATSTTVQPKIVGGQHLRLATKGDQNAKLCTVAALIRHKLSCVCTWKASVLDSIQEEGRKLNIETLDKGVEDQLEIFDSLWSLSTGTETFGVCAGTKSDAVCAQLYEALQLPLMDDASCLLDMDGFYCAVVQHNQNFSVVHLNPCSSTGMPLDYGKSVALFHSSFHELMLYITALSQALNAKKFSVMTVRVNQVLHGVAGVAHNGNIAEKREQASSSEVKSSGSAPNLKRRLSVPEGVALKKYSVPLKRLKPESDFDKCSMQSNAVPEVLVTDVSKEMHKHVRYLQGTFHQAHRKFGANAGSQCVAMSLAAMVLHNRTSVMTWNTQQLDDVVNRGDKLYTFLTETDGISEESTGYLLIKELPTIITFNNRPCGLEYGNPIVGDLYVEKGELLDNGVAYSLKDGLTKVFETYDQCFITVSNNTCAIFHQDEQYVVFDSHARDTDGKAFGSGKSIVLYYGTLPDLCVHILGWGRRDSEQIDRNQFEITGLTVNSTVEIFNRTVSFDGSAASSTAEVHDIAPQKPEIAFCGQQHTVSQKLSEDPIQVVGDSVEDSDDGFLGATTTEYQFNVLSKETAQTLCSQLELEYRKHGDVLSGSIGALGVPCTTEKIVGDGNCFFRALSQVVCGSQQSHLMFRRKIVKHMMCNEEHFNSLVREEYSSSLKDYLDKSKMSQSNTWATEVEIHGAANLLGLDIYTHIDDHWLKYSCTGQKLSEQGIYLKNCNGNHYEPVVCTKNGSSLECHNLCNIQPTCYAKPMLTRNANRANIEKKVGNDTSQTKSTEIDSSSSSKSSSRLLTDSKYIARKKRLSKKRRYEDDAPFRHIMQTATVDKYHDDEPYKFSLKTASITKYRDNDLHKSAVCAASKQKYTENDEHRLGKCAASSRKYSENDKHRDAVSAAGKQKYTENDEHRLDKCAASIRKYSENDKHRDAVCAANKTKYHTNTNHRLSKNLATKNKSVKVKRNKRSFDFVLKLFNDTIKNGPDFVCCCCIKLCFRKQVLICKRSRYQRNQATRTAAAQCITEEYLHKCDNCAIPCKLLKSPRGKLWICRYCHGKILEGKMPQLCAANNLHLYPIPSELSCLNIIEMHLISAHIPFMKMLCLPRGAQNAVHGPVTCVPANITATTNVLPRSNEDGILLRVKLKRKMTYTGHYLYQYVSIDRIRRALQWLKRTNPYYANIDFNDDWLNQYEQDLSEEHTVDDVQPDETCLEEETLHDRQTHGMFMDTCLQPVDLGQEILDHYDTTLNIAPAEGNNPVVVLCDETNEAKSFPGLFPSGGPTYHDFRNDKVTLASYFKNRIMHADGRFARNTEYIFYAQYMTEVQKVSSCISIALRKGHSGRDRGKISANMVNDTDSLKRLLQSNEGYRFLKPIRGTPAFWAGAQKDLFAMVRQIGLPTFFCSFSAADMRWENLLTSMLLQEGRCDNVEDLDWNDKCGLLRRNPVTAARMFQHRWETFLKDVIRSPSQPIGKVVDHFYRVEFQQRGSPHIHAIFWIEDSPQIDRETDEEVVRFVDKYISCELPEDEPLLEMVSTVQTHSKRHSKSCRKKSTVCRFNFPRPPSERSFVSRAGKTDESCSQQEGVGNQMTEEQARKIMSTVKEALTDEKATFKTVSELFGSLGINQAQFESAFECTCKKTQVVLKRRPTDVWVNPYNKPLLSAWNANMDIQFVANAYACIVYVISYIAKAEREMGLLLSNAQREATKEGNMDAKKSLRKLGSVYLHNREVSAQESVYRLTQMHLKQSSRMVHYIPTGENTTRMSLPLKELQRRADSNNLTDKSMWMTSSVDRYLARPNEDIFQRMCLATFVSEYRVLSKNQTSVNRVKLGKDLGFVAKRTRGNAAVVRYVQFSPDTDPEKYFRNILQLFLPYRVTEDLKPEGFQTFEEFYHTGVCVKTTVDVNRKTFEKESEVMEHSKKVLGHTGALEDAWGEMCPGPELERLECEQEVSEQVPAPDEHTDAIPDLADAGAGGNRFDAHGNGMCRSDALNLLRSLNVKQREIFYQVRQWCIEKVNGKNPKPFNVFVTGGAGTGKSHLIKAIHYEASRLLSQVASSPDKVSVLLTAPTGIAAYSLGASTIHSTFSIGLDVKPPYTPLGEERVSTLRAELSDLQILVIDEISMVNHNLLAYVHGRLRQIKRISDHSPFGKVSVIAVGDFYQLKPVRGKCLYLEDTLCDFWTEKFTIAHLNTIVRQQDTVFAELLNRLRTRAKTTALVASDIAILKKCETGESTSALHIFATNAQVNDHNIKQLSKSCPENLCVEALDYEKSLQSGCMELKKGHFRNVYKSYLPERLPLGKGARVMLIKNIDVSDGLVNGVCGNVVDIVKNIHNTFVSTVFVTFDDEKVGANRRKRLPSTSENPLATPINRDNESIRKGKLRKQFPLKLAWACTIHKVQGLTVDKAVVSLRKIFEHGQAYVALSRVKSLNGLTIQDFEESAIYCKDNIQDSLDGMPSFLSCATTPSQGTQSFSIFSMNVQSLDRHVPDLAAAMQPFDYSCVAVTETWLTETVANDTTRIENYNFHSVPRCKAYNSTDAVLKTIKDQQQGGVGIYCRDQLEYTILDIPNVNIECIASHFDRENVIVVVVYRPQTYPLPLFKQNMKLLTSFLNTRSDNVVILGDFNHDQLKSLSMSSFMEQLGYLQLVSEPTTEKGTLIDHVYDKNTSQYLTETKVIPMYFSTHEAVQCLLTKNT